MKDENFKAGVRINISMVANLLYAAVSFISGAACSSLWLSASGSYFLFLGIIRAVLAHSYNTRNKRGGFEYEEKQYKLTAWLLFALNIPMGYVIILLIKIETDISYPLYTIYAVAAFTFYKLIASIASVIRYRGSQSPVLSASKSLSLIAALMSLTVLQDAMIAEFSDGNRYYREMMNTLTGIFVYAAVIAITVYMIFHSLNLIGED